MGLKRRLKQRRSARRARATGANSADLAAIGSASLVVRRVEGVADLAGAAPLADEPRGRGEVEGYERRDQAAARLGVSVEQFHRHLRPHLAARTIKGRPYYLRADVDAVFARHVAPRRGRPVTADSEGVQVARTLRGEGASLRVIGEKLRGAGYRTPAGREHWHASSVAHVLGDGVSDSES